MEISIKFANLGNLKDIVKLINEENERSGAVMKVTPIIVRKWIRNRHCAIAISEGRVIGHEALNVWPRSGWAELRSAVVEGGFRGQGIGYRLTKMLIDAYKKENANAVLVSLKNKTEKGNGILKGLGFREIDIHTVPMELFTIRSYSERKAFRMDSGK